MILNYITLIYYKFYLSNFSYIIISFNIIYLAKISKINNTLNI